MERFRWGILGTGSIARKFAAGVAAVADLELAAVGSRTQAAADRFAGEFAIDRRHASYAALAADPAVDAIYIATPHSYHMENTLLCLDHGKPVLVEKPFAINAVQGERMVETARAKGVFLMEAMWTRYLPIMVEVRRLVDEGAIGQLRMVQADFGFRAGFNPAHRLFDPALGGGGLLDVGIYPISLAYMLLGRPEQVTALAELGQTGVDEQLATVFRYRGGELALLSTAITTNTPHEATILGTTGWIRIHSPWWVGTALTLHRAGEPPQRLERPFVGNGYSHEAMEVAACVRAGKLESAIMPLDESLAILHTMDVIRRQVGVNYPME
jgi:predicted dehydrogenase